MIRREGEVAQSRGHWSSTCPGQVVLQAVETLRKRQSSHPEAPVSNREGAGSQAGAWTVMAGARGAGGGLSLISLPLVSGGQWPHVSLGTRGAPVGTDCSPTRATFRPVDITGSAATPREKQRRGEV